MALPTAAAAELMTRQAALNPLDRHAEFDGRGRRPGSTRHGGDRLATIRRRLNEARYLAEFDARPHGRLTSAPGRLAQW